MIMPAKPESEKKQPVTIGLHPDSKDLLISLSKRLKVSQPTVVENALDYYAKHLKMSK